MVSVWISDLSPSRVIVYMCTWADSPSPGNTVTINSSSVSVVRYIGGSGGIQVDVPGSSAKEIQDSTSGLTSLYSTRRSVDPGDWPGGLTWTKGSGDRPGGPVWT